VSSPADGAASIGRVTETRFEVREAPPAREYAALDKEDRRSDRLIVIRPASRWLHLDLKELWHYRELAARIVWRDLKVRYKQTFVGIGWAVIQPFMSMVVFTFVLGRFGKFPHIGLKTTPVFILSGLIPWQYFSSAMTSSGTSLVGNISLVTKVYFPRVLIPFAAVLVPFVDFLLACLVLVGVTVYYGEPVDGPVWPAPAFLLIAIVMALGGGLLLSAVNVRYRDVPYVIPYLLQMGMFVSAVFYPISNLPTRWQWVFALNPMNAVVTGFRWALYNSPAPVVGQTAVSVATALVIFFGGLAFFRRSEPRFADTI
jgi:lipopolysaccharide transport system permease protein